LTTPKEVFPKSVITQKRVYDDKDGKAIVFDDLMTIDTTQLPYTIVGAIQELNKQNEILMKEVKELKKRIEELEKK
jgi:hypothetical protein